MKTNSKTETWKDAFARLSTQISESDDVDDISHICVELACDSADAEGALLFLPIYDNQWWCESSYSRTHKTIPGALGLPFGLASDELSHALQKGLPWSEPTPESVGTGSFEEESWTSLIESAGPTLYVPVISRGKTCGCLVLWRLPNAGFFDEEDAKHATTFMMQAAFIMELLEKSEAELASQMQEERERIARDLHDLAIQDLFATGMQLEKLRREIRNNIPRSVLDLKIVESLSSLEGSVKQIRRIVYGLKGVEQPSGLVDRLRHEASMGRGLLGFAPTLVVEVDHAPASSKTASSLVSEGLADDIVAVMREALSNVARHAHASSVQVNVEIHGKGLSGEIVLSVIDDGTGVDPSRSRDSGLANMQRRAILRGGTFAFGSGPRGRGTSLVWRSPLA